jgi:myo-inositol 2-dehydrogenase/D-chiro-inositol 1-dehydrogenase
VGRIGVLHARTLLALEGVSLTVADADSGRARKVAAELGIEAAETPEELVAAGVDGLVIATATAGHAPLVRLGVDATVPVFCEKPVALELPTMDALVAAADSAGILVQVGFQRRFDAGYRTLRDAVANGSIGRILVMRAATHDPYPPAKEYLAASGGIFGDLHIHDFDAIRFVSGDEIVEVYADGSALETPWLEQYGDVDVAAAVLRLAGGGLVILSGTRHDPLGYDVRLEVFGTKDSPSPGSTSARRSPDARARLSRLLGPLPASYEPSSRPSSRASGPGGKRLFSGEGAALRAALAADRSWPSTGRWH